MSSALNGYYTLFITSDIYPDIYMYMWLCFFFGCLLFSSFSKQYVQSLENQEKSQGREWRALSCSVEKKKKPHKTIDFLRLSARWWKSDLSEDCKPFSYSCAPQSNWTNLDKSIQTEIWELHTFVQSTMVYRFYRHLWYFFSLPWDYETIVI